MQEVGGSNPSGGTKSMKDIIKILKTTISVDYPRADQPYRALALLMVDSKIVDRPLSKQELRYIISESISHFDEAEFEYNYNFFTENLP